MNKIILAVLAVLLNFSQVSAMEVERENLICALSSAAAYENDTGELARNFFIGRDWKINFLENPSKKSDVKIYFMSHTNSGGEVMKIFFIAGTEDRNDYKINKKAVAVPLNDDENITVHSDFKKYADAVLADGILDFLVEYVNNHADEKIYFTGHSLGGAVSLIVAARLADSGANIANVKVVTFGAPAVGNKNFVENYKDKINLTRLVIEKDEIVSALEGSGYENFGEVVKCKQPATATQDNHAMAIYLDCALRNFYDAGLKIESDKKIDTPVYIAPVTIVHKSFIPSDKKYVEEILRDGYASIFANVTFAEPLFVEIKKADDFSYSVRKYVDAAKKSGSKFIIVPLIQAKPVQKAEKRTLRISIEENIFDAAGKLVSMNTSAVTTADVTSLGAAFFVQENLREEREKISTAEKD